MASHSRPRHLRVVNDLFEPPPGALAAAEWDDVMRIERCEWELACSYSMAARFYDELAIRLTGHPRPLPRRRHAHLT